MPNFTGPEGELKDLYLTDPEILERYVGNQLWLWGINNVGQLGNNTITHRSSPVQTVSGGTNWKQVDSNGGTTAAIKTDNSLWLWGSAAYGIIGNNSSVNRSSPVQTASGGTNWKQVSCGTSHIAAIKTDGSLWLWGRNLYGELGINSSGEVTNKSTPVQTVAGGTNWKQVSCGNYYTAAIKTDGTLWVWGYNTSGELGTNDSTNRISPVQTVSGGTNWKQVSCGSATTAAIKTDGSLWLWGSNFQGVLGNNNTTNLSSPVQTVSGGTNWKQVTTNGYSTAAIKTDGSLWLWGYNTYGQLGDNTITSKSSPIQTISAGNNWKQVSAGIYSTAAIKTDGTLWLWGYNGNYGQLGDNTLVNKSSPIQTIAAGNNWKQVIIGGAYLTASVTYTES